MCSVSLVQTCIDTKTQDTQADTALSNAETQMSLLDGLHGFLQMYVGLFYFLHDDPSHTFLCIAPFVLQVPVDPQSACNPACVRHFILLPT